MTRTLLRLSAAAVALAVAGCHGPSPDWNGTWKLDPAKSYVRPRIFTISTTPDGMYHSGSGTATSNFRCDGKGNPAANDLTAFCTQKNSSNLEITNFRNGSKVLAVHWDLSRDGKALTIDSTALYPDGAARSKEFRYVRTSGSTGFAGNWRNVDPLEGRAQILQFTIGSNALHYTFPENEVHVDAFIDGTDAAIQGPFVPSGETISLRESGPRELSSAMKRNGRVESVGYWRLSDDGRSLTESYWLPGRPNEKEELVYQKQ